MFRLEMIDVFDDVLINFVQDRIDEEFNARSEFKFAGYEDEKLVGVIVYELMKVDSGQELPRFIHVVLSEEFRRSKQAVKLLRATEKELKKMGYSQLVAYILDQRKHMQVLAEKFGYKKYGDFYMGSYYYKNI